MILFLLSSGLFLGWSLGANDAANIFGTAVGTKMIKFRTAAAIASIFLILGAVISGAGASHTLGKLGAINAIHGAFMVALAAAITVFGMTKIKVPVSTSQAIVGAIIGWNFFSGTLTDYQSLVKIVSTWIFSPLLAAFFSAILYLTLKKYLDSTKISIFRLDNYTRVGLLVVGAFGAYSLGANNIANVMGVFVSVSPFKTLDLGIFTLSGIQQLFFLGALAISVGVYTYSHRVMKMVGSGVIKLSPQAALIVVFAESIVLFLFASKGLHDWFVSHNIPAIPLVPVSSSQLVIGAILGIGLAQGGKNIKLGVLGKIATGWVTTPLIAALITFISLFFLQNTFDMKVYEPVNYSFSQKTIERLEQDNIHCTKYNFNDTYEKALVLQKVLKEKGITDKEHQKKIFQITKVEHFQINNKENLIISSKLFSGEQIQSLKDIININFNHRWEFFEAISFQPTDLQKEFLVHSFRTN